MHDNRLARAVALLVFSAAPAQAAELSPAVVVTATRTQQSSFYTPAAIDAVDGGALRDHRLRVNFSEGIGRVPGLNVQNRYNYAQDLQVSSRGFGARASFGVRGVRLLQDGIPLTMPDGQGQTGLLDLDAAQNIEVLRGPFAALYGNSSGAVINLITGPVQRSGFELNATDAEYGLWRLGTTFAAKGRTLEMSGNLSRFRTDGYRAHSEARRDVANIRVRYSPDSRSSLTMIANALYQPDTQDPLGLTQIQMDEDPRQAGSNAVELNTRKSIRHLQAGLTYRRQVSDRNQLQMTGYAGDRDLTQYLANPGIPLTSSGGVVDLARKFGGASLQWDHSGQLIGAPYKLTLGAEYDRMKEHRRGYVNSGGTRGELRRNEDDTVYDINGYAIAEWRPSPRWVLSGGMRHSDVRFETVDHFMVGPNPDDSGHLSFASTQPVVGILFEVTPHLNVFASAGRAFETPTFAELAYRPDGSSGLNLELKAATSDNYEVGTKWQPGERLRIDTTLFRSNTKQDIVTGPSPFPGRNTFVNAARTQREGAEMSLQATTGRGLDFNFAYTYTRARFDRFINFAGLDLSGNLLPGVPQQSTYAQINWRPRETGFSTGLELRWLDRVYASDTNSAFAEDYTTVNWHAGWRQCLAGWEIDTFVRIDNLSDEDYVGSLIANAANDRFFEPSPGRVFYLGVTVGYSQH